MSHRPQDTRQQLGRKGRILATALFGLVGVACAGFLVHRYVVLPASPGASKNVDGTASDQEMQERMASLGGLGYLSGYETAPEKTGVLVHDFNLAHDGYNLFTSGHSPEATLMDMKGKVLHRWRLPYYEGWPELDPDHKDPEHGNADYWRRTSLYENGDLLAIFDGLALLKVDRDSNLIWAYRGGFHHDLEVMDDGRVLVLTHREIPSHPSLPDHGTLTEDFITELNADGSLVRHVSILDAFARSQYTSLLDRVRVPQNIFHTNTLEVLKGRLADRSEAFRAGNVLISLREIDVVAVLDIEQEKVVWALAGDWKMQHQPTILENGNMLLFDNQGHGGISKVIEFDPLTEEVVWAYRGDEENGFHSPVLGSNVRLPGGNTLITESCAGRAFEVNTEGAIVWEFVDSKRIGPTGQWQLIPTMCEMLRIEKEYVRSWLE